jgi:SpoVK/Ycf46/Vps4 family AAA+-type ATPase
MWEPVKSATKEITRAFSSQYPLIYLVSWEEERLEQMLQSISAAHYQDNRQIVLWTAARGFYTKDDKDLDDSKDPQSALQHIASAKNDAVYYMKDLPAYFESDKSLVRTLRDLYHQLRHGNTYIVFSHPLIKIPDELKKEVFLIEIGLPADEEIFNYVTRITKGMQLENTFSDDWIFKCSSAMRGMELNEVRHLLLRLINEKKLGLEEALEEVYDEKAQLLLKESCLRVVPHRFDMDQIGGLDNLKDWVLARSHLFTREAHDAGIPLPSGILFMGVSGCGKSLAAKTIAAAWDLQLVRLDMNLILSGVYGPPEFAFDRAIRVAESVSPVVLWIDEIENAFGYDDESSTRGNINIFSSFLTWMQEKPASVFVAATANRIRRLPAEMIRKGRFDQLFFLDLPTETEREEIFRIHIERNGGRLEEFDLSVLATLTQGRSGAELEQAIKAARVDAFAEKRTFTQRDISRNSSQMVPLSETMHEQIKQLRDWSYNRATPASKTKRR